jgi:hypothetical protein
MTSKSPKIQKKGKTKAPPSSIAFDGINPPFESSNSLGPTILSNSETFDNQASDEAILENYEPSFESSIDSVINVRVREDDNRLEAVNNDIELDYNTIPANEENNSDYDSEEVCFRRRPNPPSPEYSYQITDISQHNTTFQTREDAPDILSRTM